MIPEFQRRDHGWPACFTLQQTHEECICQSSQAVVCSGLEISHAAIPATDVLRIDQWMGQFLYYNEGNTLQYGTHICSSPFTIALFKFTAVLVNISKCSVS